MVILSYRSPYLKKILSSIEKKNDGTLINIKLSNILPEIFQIILRYIYSGRLSLKDHDTSDIIKILITSKELDLQELIPYLESYLIENEGNWMEQNFDLIYRTSFDNDSFLQLQKFCKDLITENPEKIFNSSNFLSISKDLLLLILKNVDNKNNNDDDDDNINNNVNDNVNIINKMNQVQIWDYVLRWGIAQNSQVFTDPSNYSNDDFILLKNTLQNFIPFIKFTKFTSKEFLDKVYHYKKALPEDLCENLIIYFLDSNNNQNNNEKSISHTTSETDQLQTGLETIEKAKDAQSKPLIKEIRRIQSESQTTIETKKIQPKPLMVKKTSQIQQKTQMTKKNPAKPLMDNETSQIKPKPQMTKENQSKSLMEKVTIQIQPESQMIEETKANQSKLMMAKAINKIQLESQEMNQLKSLMANKIKPKPQTNNEAKANHSRPLMAEETNQIQQELPQSQIITNQHAELIIKWIDEANIEKSSKSHSLVSKFYYTPKSNCTNCKYKLKLLFRGSRDGFMPKEFHNICGKQSSTLAIIKVKDSNEILGGYNPIEWKSNFGYGTTKDSFIFSFANKENINDHIISRIEDEKKAINYGSLYGPSFGFGDLIVHGGPGNDNFYDSDNNYCKKSSYEKQIRNTNDTFSIEEYEIFQIIKKN
ncbi:BTB/POZ protein [Rhizophagus clarus]|nr:BTB/POZ protein [Rhizophagus clarus]